MYTYLQRPVCKKEKRPHTYIRAGSRTPTRAYVWPGLMYMAGSEQRKCVVIVFMGRQRNASCSSGGNGMRRVHREATKRVRANRLGRNRRWKRGLAYRRMEETALCSTGHVRNGVLLIGGVWRTAKRRKRTSYGRNGVLLVGRGVAYRKTEETDLCWSATVETGVLLIGRGCGVPQNGRN